GKRRVSLAHRLRWLAAQGRVADFLAVHRAQGVRITDPVGQVALQPGQKDGAGFARSVDSGLYRAQIALQARYPAAGLLAAVSVEPDRRRLLRSDLLAGVGDDVSQMIAATALAGEGPRRSVPVQADVSRVGVGARTAGLKRQ